MFHDCTIFFISLVFKSNQRSEDSYFGHGHFFVFFFRKKSQNALITTDVLSYIIMHLLMHVGIYSIFEFN